MHKQLLLTAALCAIIARPVIAGSFDAKNVPSRAKWALHLDADGLKKSAVGKMILEELGKEQAQGELTALKEMTHLDPRTDINSVTLFGLDDQEQNMLMMVEGAMDSAHLTTLATANDDYATSRHGDHVIHAWTEKNAAAGNRKVNGAFYAGSTLLLSQSADLVRSALDTLEGRAASLAGGELIAGLDAVEGRFLVAAADVRDLKTLAPQAAMLGQASWAQLSLGETADDVTGSLALHAGSAEAAKQMQTMLQGALIIAMLSQDKNPELAQLASALSVKADGPQIEALLALPTKLVLDYIRENASKSLK